MDLWQTLRNFYLHLQIFYTDHKFLRSVTYANHDLDKQFNLMIRLEDVLKISLQDALKMP